MSNRIRSILLLMLVSAVMFVPCLVRAQSPALSFNGYTPSWEYTQDSYLIGWYFQVNTPTTVSALGWYNDSNGLSSDHPVGIYDIQAGAFIASTTVRTSDPLTGVFRYRDLASPVTLTAGKSYAIVGVSYEDHYISFAQHNNIVTASAITYLGGAIDYSGNATQLHAPVEYYPGGSYWPATNFKIGASATPGTITSISPETARVGSPNFNMTITGTGFTSAPTVRFDKTVMPLVSATDTQIVITVPASMLTTARTYNVSVATNVRSSNVMPFRVTNVVNTPPRLQIVGNFRTGRDPLSGNLYVVLLLENVGGSDITNINFSDVRLAYGPNSSTLLPLFMSVEPGASPAGNFSRTAPGERLQLRWDFTPGITTNGVISVRGTSSQGAFNAGTRFLQFP
jgi:hypothetical protein